MIFSIFTIVQPPPQSTLEHFHHPVWLSITVTVTVIPHFPHKSCGPGKPLNYVLSLVLLFITKSCLTLCNPTDCSMPGSSFLHCLLVFAKIYVHWMVMLSSHLILCHPFLLLPSIFPSIRVHSSEPALHIRWPKYWGFSFSISPSNEYSGLISFKIDWFDLFAVQGTLKSLFQNHNSKAHSH